MLLLLPYSGFLLRELYSRVSQKSMRENFNIAERYKSRDFVSFHFVFAVNYVRDKNALYGIIITMTYNQVQSFQINDYANHYEDIEITGYRAIYSKSIAGWDIARLISWLGTAGPVDCFNKSLSDCYIRVYRSF